MKVVTVAPSSAVCESGSIIDFGICSQDLQSILSMDLDWSAPRRPHCSLVWIINMQAGSHPVPQLLPFLDIPKEVSAHVRAGLTGNSAAHAFGPGRRPPHPAICPSIYSSGEERQWGEKLRQRPDFESPEQAANAKQPTQRNSAVTKACEEWLANATAGGMRGLFRATSPAKKG